MRIRPLASFLTGRHRTMRIRPHSLWPLFVLLRKPSVPIVTAESFQPATSSSRTLGFYRGPRDEFYEYGCDAMIAAFFSGTFTPCPEAL
jgi:hypothetical protein